MEGQALETLYALYRRELLLYLHALCGSWPLAEDLVQETFIRALLSLSESHGNLRAWLYRVARNLCIDRLRREARTTPVAEPHRPATAADPATDPARALLAAERDRDLYAAVLALPPAARQVIVLQYFAGLPQAEIAAVMGTSHANVRVMAHRAKNQLRKMLEVETDG